jgi:hypothetical protein
MSLGPLGERMKALDAFDEELRDVRSAIELLQGIRRI